DAFDYANQDHVEALGGLQIGILRTWHAFVAGGIGLNEGYGTPDWRVVGGTRIAFDAAEGQRLVPETAPLRSDKDGDGILDDADPDGKDTCPTEHGTAEFQGCKTAQKVTITDGKIATLDKIYFATNKAKILKQSFPLLDNVANVLRAHGELKKVRIEGHTDD